MKRTTLIKAVAGAGALFILGTGVAYAGDADQTTTTTVTVSQNRSITLTQSAAGGFTVAGTMARRTTENATSTYTLGYVTDFAGFDTGAGGTTPCAALDGVGCTMDRVTVRATTDADSTLGAAKITLHVIPGVLTNTFGAAPVTKVTGDINALTTAAPLATGLNGTVTEVVQSFPVTFTADAGADAIFGAHSVVLTYNIGATPNNP